jgi:hypothetical protein
VAAGILVLIFLLLQATAYPVCRDWGLVCENTGSRRGHRQWFFGLRTGDWYKRSKLEEFVASTYPNELSHRWTSYMGTGKNVLGQPVLRGHGTPGPIVNLQLQMWDAYVEQLSDPDKKALYETFRSGDEDRIGQAVERALGVLCAHGGVERSETAGRHSE